MLTMMLLAHLLGDYVLQFDGLVRWKLRSIWGVAAHGGIVTLTALACAALIDPGWWLYALLIGVIHTCVDVVRARLIHTKSTTMDLILLVLDQIIHVTVIVLVVALSGYAALQPPQTVARPHRCAQSAGGHHRLSCCSSNPRGWCSDSSCAACGGRSPRRTWASEKSTARWSSGR